jgi:hypothetical protein
MAIKFHYNGIKGNDGKLHQVSYSGGTLINYPDGTITIYSQHYRPFSAEVGATFIVENNSDGQSDYFETDRIRVEPSHPLYAQVLTAMKAQAAREAEHTRRKEEL